jgi:hypothetical protein
MLAPVALLLATYTTFGPIAQDETSLYVADHGSIVRVDKNDPAKRTILTTPTPRRIAAIDVDGDRVYYATAPAPDCREVPTFPPATTYVHYNCSLADTDTDHELRSASASGGDEQLLFRESDGITEITHDAGWIYWLSPSNGTAPLSATLKRKNKNSGSWDVIAANLAVSVVNQHPFVLAGDTIHVVSGAHLVRIPASGGIPLDITEVLADSSIEAIDGTLYYVRTSGSDVGALDIRTGVMGPVRFPLVVEQATLPVAILGAAPGLAVLSELSGWTHTAFRGWIASDLCAGSATLLGSTTGDVFHAYFIPPLVEPPIAVDSTGVYVVDRRVTMFPSPPGGCGRRRAIGH